ncbi:MAG: hypothetical protein C4291_03375 [Candidatus Dadabacteria bacterium]
MKKFFILILLIVSSLFWTCGDPNQTGSVTLDGPILESINKAGKLEFNGVVVNSSDKPVRSIYVVMILKDSNRKIIEATSTPVLGEDPQRTLQPSERAFFTISTKSDPQRVASKDVEIYSEDASTPPPSS